MRKGQTQRKGKINVWAGIVGSQVIEPIISQVNLNRARYLELLKTKMKLKKNSSVFGYPVSKTG